MEPDSEIITTTIDDSTGSHEALVLTKNDLFSANEIEVIITKSIEVILMNEDTYKNKKVNEWTNSIITNCLKELQHLEKSFKYVVSCVIMQNNGAGLVSTASTYWDQKQDGYTKLSWKNEAIYCLVTIFAASTSIEDNNDIE